MPSQKTLQHQQVVFVQFPVESLLLSSELRCTQSFVCVLQDWSLYFSQCCGSLVIKSLWLSRSDSLGIPSPFVTSLGWEAWCEVPNLHDNGKTYLALLFSTLWVTHPRYGLWFLSWLFSYHLAAASSLSLDVGFFSFFLVKSCILLWMVIQQLVVILKLLLEEMSTCPSAPSWTGKSIWIILRIISVDYISLEKGLHFPGFSIHPSALNCVLDIVSGIL